MGTLSIILGAISLALLIVGIMSFVYELANDSEDNVLPQVIVTIIGGVGLFLCLVI